MGKKNKYDIYHIKIEEMTTPTPTPTPTPTAPTTTIFKCPILLPMCPRTPLMYMICKQLNIKRVTTKHKWLCFSCTTNDDSYQFTGSMFRVNEITHSQFMHICLQMRFTKWADGTYKWYVAGGGDWGEFGIVKISQGKIVFMQQHVEV